MEELLTFSSNPCVTDGEVEPIKMKCRYEDVLLEEDENRELAFTSAVLSMGAYAKEMVENTDFKPGYSIENLEKLGFGFAQRYHYEEDNGAVCAYTFAYKAPGIYAIVIRGTANGQEWFGDCKVGGVTNETNVTRHHNFRDCSYELLENFNHYSRAKLPEKVWIMGHSRGGSIGMIAAKILKDFGFDVHGYFFAPAQCINPEIHQGDFKTIHSYNFELDLVPQAIPKGWNLGFIGNVHYPI